MDDETLIREYRKTEEKALLEELILRNFDRVYRFVASMLKSRSFDHAHLLDDLVQEVLLTVIRNIDGFRGESRFSSWIYRIAFNRVKKHFETDRKTLFYAENEEVESVPEKNAESPFNMVSVKELDEKIDDAIMELSPALRSAILLTAVEGLSPEEAAEVEGCTTANIHWRVHKAREILKGRLKKYLE